MLALTTARGEDARVRVRKSGSAKSVLNVAGFAARGGTMAHGFQQTLERDLERSGWFQLVRGGNAEYNLSGACSQEGGQLRVEGQVYRIGDQARMFGKAYRQPASDARALAHRVADDIVEAVTGRKGMASTRLAMVGTRSSKKEIYLCDADGAGLIQLTRDGSVSVAPTWGPAGRRLLYTAYLKRFPDVYMIDVTSGSRRRIANYPGLNTGAALAPNGRDVAIILSKDGNPELYVMNLGGGGLTRLTRTARAAEASPCWSPDGERVVFVSDRSGRPQLYIVSRAGGRPQRLTLRGVENVAPDWGPNGLIAYSSRMGGRYGISVIDPATKQAKQLPLDGADYEDPSWAPDGRHIACTRTERYRSKVYLLDTMGDPPVALTTYEGDWFSPAWAP
jgi:TolB protein